MFLWSATLLIPSQRCCSHGLYLMDDLTALQKGRSNSLHCPLVAGWGTCLKPHLLHVNWDMDQTKKYTWNTFLSKMIPVILVSFHATDECSSVLFSSKFGIGQLFVATKTGSNVMIGTRALTRGWSSACVVRPLDAAALRSCAHSGSRWRQTFSGILYLWKPAVL